MSKGIDERIMAAVIPIVPECVADFYKGNAEEYCTFNYSEMGEAFGDNRPGAIRYLIQLHYYLPMHPVKRSSMRVKQALRRAILEAGFTCPDITNASDGKDQHYVFEFEGLEREAQQDGEV